MEKVTLQIDLCARDAFSALVVENAKLKRENEQLRCDVHGVCSACVHGDEGFEADACRRCGESGCNWKWRGDAPAPCITQKPLSWEDAEESLNAGELLFVERYADDTITAQTEPPAPDAIAFMRKTLYGLGVNEGILCGFRYWRTCPTEAERACAEWTRI